MLRFKTAYGRAVLDLFADLKVLVYASVGAVDKLLDSERRAAGEGKDDSVVRFGQADYAVFGGDVGTAGRAVLDLAGSEAVAPTGMAEKRS